MESFPDIDFKLPGTVTGFTAHGTVTEDEWGRYALVKGVAPVNPSGSPYAQALSAFESLDWELGKAGMEFSHVARTWIYADRILDWYPELNRARDAFFKAKGVYGRYIPASTGIGWTNGIGAKVVIGAFTVQARKPGLVEVEALQSPLQCSALEYGSSFSRAAEIRTPGWRRVLVSGTASIAPASHDVAHVDDIAKQIECTMGAVDAIYKSRGMSWKDISGALVYLRDPGYEKEWRKWLDAHPEFPRAHSRSMVADVCRREWLFEIESDATQWK